MSFLRPRREAVPSRLWADERGSVAVSILLIPIAFTAIFGTIHLGLIMHGRNVAAAAAQDALHTAAQYGATAREGEAVGDSIMELYPALESADLRVTKIGNVVTVTVTGEVTTPLDFANSLNISFQGPAEDYWDESER